MQPAHHLIGVVGDLHFYPDVKEPEKWEDAYDELGDWIVEEFSKRGIRWVVFMGDIFHGKVRKEHKKSVDFRTLTGVINFFRKFNQFENIIILGNHDCFHADSPEHHGLEIFDSWSNIRVVDKAPKFLYYPQNDELGFEGEWDSDDMLPISKFAFVPWGTDVKDIPNADTIFGHFDIQTFKFNAHKVSDHGFKSEQFFRRTKTVVSGHYHHYQSRDYQKGNITYVGTPIQNNWAEAGKDSFICVFDAKERKLVEKIENTFSPKHVHVALSDLMSKKVDASAVMPKNKVRLQIDQKVDDRKIQEFTTALSSLGMMKLEVNKAEVGGGFDDEAFTEKAATLDYRGALGEYIEGMDIPEEKDKVKEKGLEYYDQT